MKTKLTSLLHSTALGVALCSTAAAAPCTSGGNRPNPYPNSPYGNSPYNNPYNSPVTSNVSPPFNGLPTNDGTSQNVFSSSPSVPQSRLTVVPAVDTTTSTSTTSATPVGRLSIAPATTSTNDEKPATTTKPAPSTADKDLTAALDSTAPLKEASKIADKLKGLVGTWMAVSRQSDGALSTVELRLDDNGWGKLTVPGPNGDKSTTTRKIDFENDELKLIGDNGAISLGKLVDFDSTQMVLERSGAQVTFVRP